ncbi:MAG: hypothetical protein RR719_09780, partial [Akkermansia sp.]
MNKGKLHHQQRIIMTLKLFLVRRQILKHLLNLARIPLEHSPHITLILIGINNTPPAHVRSINKK